MFSVMSVCLSVQAITFEPLDIETSFLVCSYILIISKSSLSIKVIGSRSCSRFEITFVLEKHVVEDVGLFTNHLAGK